MEKNLCDESSVEILRDIRDMMLGWNIPGSTNTQAAPIYNGPVNYITNCAIETLNGGEQSRKIKTMECIEHLVQQPQMVQDALECMPQPLLKLNDFDSYIPDASKAEPIKAFLREELEGKEPEEVTTVIYCAAESGLLKGIPTYRAVMHAFGQIVTKQLYISCMAAGFDDEEVAPYMERFRKKRAELLKGDEAPLQPLPWQRLFTAIPGVMDIQLVTQKMKMVYNEFNTVYFDCTEEAFLACFGLPEGSRPEPLVWLSSGRVLNYFMKKLFPCRVPSWEQTAALFVKDDGTEYSTLCKQNLTDEEEKATVDKVFDKILKEKSYLDTPS